MDSSSLSHTKWKCQYHIVFIPKYRRKVIITEEAIKRYIQEQQEEAKKGKVN